MIGNIVKNDSSYESWAKPRQQDPAYLHPETSEVVFSISGKYFYIVKAKEPTEEEKKAEEERRAQDPYGYGGYGGYGYVYDRRYHDPYAKEGEDDAKLEEESEKDADGNIIPKRLYGYYGPRHDLYVYEIVVVRPKSVSSQVSSWYKKMNTAEEDVKKQKYKDKIQSSEFSFEFKQVRVFEDVYKYFYHGTYPKLTDD